MLHCSFFNSEINVPQNKKKQKNSVPICLLSFLFHEKIMSLKKRFVFQYYLQKYSETD